MTIAEFVHQAGQKGFPLDWKMYVLDSNENQVEVTSVEIIGQGEVEMKLEYTLDDPSTKHAYSNK